MTTVRALLVTLAVALGPLPAAAPANADPPGGGQTAGQTAGPSGGAGAGDAAQQLEVVVEQYNALSENLRTTKAKAAETAGRLAPLQKQVNDAYAEVGAIAAAAYRGAGIGAVSELVTSGSPTVFVERLTTLDRLAHHTHGRIAALLDATARYQAELRTLDDLVAGQTSRQAELAARKAKIESDLDRLEARPVAGTRSSRDANRDRYRPPPVPGAASRVLAYAVAALGRPYRWAGSGPDGYDCSGLTSAAWRAGGVALPHSAALQWYQVAHISRADLSPGDLVFYYPDRHHVAIYAGNGKVIHAPRPGDVVRVADIDSMPIYGYGRPR